LVGYYGLLDVGVRSAILRYVSKHKELNQQDSVNEVVASAFYYYLGACCLVILATHISVGPVSRFFSIHNNVLADFKSLFLLAGIVQGLMLPLIVFASSLEAAGRFDQVYLTTVTCLVLRVVAIIYVLHAGGGLFAVGATTILSQLLSYCIQVPLALRAHPDRKSTRLNSSHLGISYAVFCLKKKNNNRLTSPLNHNTIINIAERVLCISNSTST